MPIILIIVCLFSSITFSAPLLEQAHTKKINLSMEEEKILEIGHISDSQYIIGGILGTYPLGLGIGHAVQGRWSDKGWIFTAGELGSLTVALMGALGCVGDELEELDNDEDDCSGASETLLVVGLVGYVGFRIWEAVDVWAVPPSHNRKYKKLKKQIQETPELEVKTSLNLVPLVNPKMGNGLGLTLIF